MLEDKFGRRFHYLRLSVTDVCNFSCQYCLPDGYQCDSSRDFLSLPEIEVLTKAFARLGTSKIRVTGGEPSLRKDLPQILSTCKQTPGIEQVALTTNGFKLPAMLDDWIDAGLDALNVSIDSLDPRMFASITGHDKLQTILKGLDKALNADLKVKVNVVLMRQFNAAEINNFLDWLKHMPVTLRFIELMQTGDNKVFFERNHVQGSSIKSSLLDQGWQPLQRLKTAGPAEEFSHPDFAGKIGLIMPYSKDFCHSCNRLRVSSKGDLHLCLFAEQGLSLRHYLQSGDTAGLMQHLQSLLQDKQASHWLQQGYTGATQHLAMLGG